MKYKNRSNKTLKERFEQFVKLSEEKHGKGVYDYMITQDDYVNTRSYVRIKCNRCGETFKTLPQSHSSSKPNLHGACQMCHIPSVAIKDLKQMCWNDNLGDRIAEFRERMNFRHNNAYDYPLLEKEFKNEYSEVTVHCKKCGHDFQRKARCQKDEKRYGGCPECNKETMKINIAQKNKERQHRNQTTKDLPKPYGCIYKITNIKNGKFYIGYTNMTAKLRFKAHWDESVQLSRGNGHCKSYLHNAMIKYGKEAFSINVVEAFQDRTPYYIASREKKYIAKLKPDYNISEGGEIGGPGKRIDLAG